MTQKESNRQSGPFVRIFPDQPVTSSAGLAFEFEGLAQTLAELAWNPDNQTPFTVVVRGGWGRGKTILLRQAQRLLDEPQKEDGAREVRTVWFNAWKYPNEDSVLAGLLGEVLRGEAFNDIEAVAGIQGSRHSRHIKRFLNDLSMTLAMLRNSGSLGDLPTQLSERVVVAWYLLREGLPAEKWRGIYALPPTSRPFCANGWLLRLKNSSRRSRKDGVRA
ncbi:MAG: P-loop NTPase fold protein [Pseudomonadota bacterium]